MAYITNCFFLALIISFNPQLIQLDKINTESFIFIIVPIFCLVYPSVAKTFNLHSFSINSFSYFSWLRDWNNKGGYEARRHKEEKRYKKEQEKAQQEEIRRARERDEERAKEEAESKQRREEKERQEQAHKQQQSAEENKSNKYEQYFAVLELPSTATFEEVKKQYKLLLKIYHPDKNPHDEKARKYAEDKTKAINKAFETLKLKYFKTDLGP